LIGARSSGGSVGRHHTCLTTNGHQNASVAEDEDQQYDDIEGQNVPDPVGHPGRLALPEYSRVAG